MITLLAQVQIGPTYRSPFTQVGDVGKLVTSVVSNLYVLAGVLLLTFILLGGLSMIRGAGQNNPQKAGQGKQAATYAFIGFLIIFGSYWIIQLIEAITGLSILK